MRYVVVLFLSLFFSVASFASDCQEFIDAKTHLLVIDMQDGFLQHLGSQNPDFQERVLKEVQKAKDSNIPVICVEARSSFCELGPTIPLITDILRGYPAFKVLEKDQRSCYKSLKAFFDANNIPFDKTLRVCGIFTSECVRASVLSLFDDRSFKMIVLADCCADTTARSHEHSLYYLKHLGDRARNRWPDLLRVEYQMTPSL